MLRGGVWMASACEWLLNGRQVCGVRAEADLEAAFVKSKCGGHASKEAGRLADVKVNRLSR